MSQTEPTEEDVDFQIGTQDIDASGSITNDENVMEFDYETGAIFKRLADDIYSSPEAGLREPLTNSITSCRRVMRTGECTDPVITITAQDGDQPMMRLRDMGEGISKSVLKNVLMFIGRSTARDDGELSGQYGMGFLASYKLVGMNGGFIMYTNPRNSSEGPYRGLFKPGAFEPDTEGEIPPLLGDDEYGTVFEYFLKPDITIADIREWVEKHAKFSPIPIIYKELDEDGTETYNEDFYAPNLKDAYDDSPALRVDTPYYEATTSPAADNDIVLISSPVEMYGTRALRKNLPWSVDLRLKYENGLVVSGPHEGLIPTTQKQYDMMEDGRKDKYVPKEKLTDEDLTLPEATGTRERVRKNKEFLRHINSQLRDKYVDVVERTLDSFNPENEELQELSNMRKNVIIRIFKHFDDDNEEYTKTDVETKLESEYDYENPREELLEFIVTMTKQVSIISRNKYRNKYPRSKAYKLEDEDSDIYMCTSVSNSWKAEAVEISANETDIITVDKASDYEGFSKHLGWTPLKEIKKSNAGEVLGLTDEEIENMSTRSKTTSENVDSTKLTVHYGGGGRTTMKKKADSLIDTYEKDDIRSKGYRYGDFLVLFPQGGEYKISNHYSLAENRCCVASCSKKVSDYLTDNAEGIMTYTEYEQWVRSQELLTSNGTRKVSSIIESPRETIFTPKKNGYEDTILNDQIILSSISDYLHEGRFDYAHMKPLYGFIPEGLCVHIRSVYQENRAYSNLKLYITTNNPDTSGYDTYYGDEVKMYCSICLTEEQYNTPEIEAVMNTYDSINKDVVSIIEKIVQASELNGGVFASQCENEEENIRMPTVNTKYGEMLLDEVYEYTNERNVIIHSLQPKNIHVFEQKDILEFGGENLSGKNIDGCEIPNLGSNPIYVPMLESEYIRVMQEIPDETIVIKPEYRDNSFNIRNRYMYSALKLPEWTDNQLPENVVRGNSFSQTKKLVDTLKKLHDDSSMESSIDTVESAMRVTQDAVLNN